jgi:Arc/MetJ family transcription regulator
MRINIEIDDGLMLKAMRITKTPTKRATVEAGLRLLIRTHGQRSIRRLRGKIRWKGELKMSRAGEVEE